MADNDLKTTQPPALATQAFNLLAVVYARRITINGKTAAKELISKLLPVFIYPAILPNVHRITNATNAPM